MKSIRMRFGLSITFLCLFLVSNVISGIYLFMCAFVMPYVTLIDKCHFLIILPVIHLIFGFFSGLMNMLLVYVVAIIGFCIWMLIFVVYPITTTGDLLKPGSISFKTTLLTYILISSGAYIISSIIGKFFFKDDIRTQVTSASTDSGSENR